MGKFIDLTGQRFGRLTVIRRSYPNDTNNDTMWLCRCDCGNEKAIRGNSIVRGLTKSCGCILREYYNNRKLNSGVSNMHEVMRRYQRQAEQRGYSFNLTEEQFADITQKDCYYCGAKPNNSIHKKTHNGKYIYNGIDRIDNNKGYIIDNVVPACHPCNKAKSDMTLREFKNWVGILYNNISK